MNILQVVAVLIPILASPATSTITNVNYGPPSPLDSWITKLEAAENCPPEGMVDSNSLLSYGPLCYQSATFKGYALKYNLLPAAEPSEILNFISDEPTQKKLAELMIRDDWNNWHHWQNSVLGYKGRKGIGFPPK